MRRRQLLRKAACRSRPSSNSFALLRSYRAYTQCLAPSARACLSGASSDDWFAFARACHAEPLAPGSSGSSRHWSRSAGWSPTGSALVALGPFLSALVTRTGWFWLVRHFRAGLAPLAGLRWFRAGHSWSFPEKLVTRTGWFSARPAARATSLVPRWSPLCALVALLSLLVARPQVSRARLCRSLPQRRSVPRAREFHWNSAVLVSSTLMVI
jgi:hypothetical protein